MVAKWTDTFEIAESRRHRALRWVSIPLGIQSNGYALMIEEFGEEAPAIYGAWIILVQIAASCSVRGLLCTSKGVGYTASRLSLLSHFPSTVFEKLIQWCLHEEVGWLEIVSEKTVRKLLTSPRLGDAQPEAGLHNTTPPNLTRHNTTTHNTTGVSSLVVVNFDFSCSWDELTEEAGRYRKLIRLGKKLVPTENVLAIVVFRRATDGPFAEELAGRLRSGDIKDPKRYIAGSFRRACTQLGCDWDDVKPRIENKIEQIRGDG